MSDDATPATDPAAEAAPQSASNVIADPTKTHVAKSLAHDSPLISCRFDPSGRFVFAGAEDSRVWRWEIESGMKTEFAGHKSWTRGITFHPNGETMITGGYEGALIWWPVAAEKPAPIRTIAAHEGWVRAVAVSPNGELVASAGNDNLVKLWRMNDGGLVRQFAGHERHVYNLAFHPDGKQLASSDLMGNFFHWEIGTGNKPRAIASEAMHKYDPTFCADIGGSRAMSFSRDGKLLACGGITNVSNAFAGIGNPIVVVFDWEAGKEKIQLLSKAKLRGSSWGLAFHPQSFLIGASGGGGGGHLLFWKFDEQNEFHTFKLPNTARDLDLHPDGLQIATAHHDKQVRICKMAAQA